MPYRFVEDVAIADVAFIASGKTLPEMFESAALAMENAQVKKLKKVETKQEHTIRIDSKDMEMLLFNFLQELIYVKDVDQLIFSKFSAKIKEDKKGFHLTCKCFGEKIDQKKHEASVDAKAVSMHGFGIERKGASFSASVIVDV